MKMTKPQTAYESFLHQTLSLKLYMTQGARLTLLKYSRFNELFPLSVLVQEFKRIKWERTWLDRERCCFETWCRYMKKVPKKPVSILVSAGLKYVSDEIYEEMYGRPSSKTAWNNLEVISRRYLSYLISRGMLLKSVRESEVSK